MKVLVIVALAILSESIAVASVISICKSKPCFLVDVYYEALDDKSRSFFKNQLMPGYAELADYMVVNPYPFGNARIVNDETGNAIIECSNGPPECRENTAHVCVMEIIHEREPAWNEKKYAKSLNIIGCAMSADNGIDAVPKCLESLGYSDSYLKNITECQNSRLGEDLFSKYGKLTTEIKTREMSLPIIRLDGIYSEENNKAAINDFKKFICDQSPADMKPAPCST